MTVKTKNKKTTQETKKEKTLDLKINTWSKYSLKSTPDEAGEQRMESVFPTKGRGKCPPPAEEMPPLLLLVPPSGLLSMTIICQSKVLRDKKTLAQSRTFKNSMSGASHFVATLLISRASEIRLCSPLWNRTGTRTGKKKKQPETFQQDRNKRAAQWFTQDVYRAD